MPLSTCGRFRELTVLFGSAADGERVPLVLGDGRDVDEQIVAWVVVEAGRPPDHLGDNRLSEEGGYLDRSSERHR